VDREISRNIEKRDKLILEEEARQARLLRSGPFFPMVFLSTEGKEKDMRTSFPLYPYLSL